MFGSDTNNSALDPIVPYDASNMVRIPPIYQVFIITTPMMIVQSYSLLIVMNDNSQKVHEPAGLVSRHITVTL